MYIFVYPQLSGGLLLTRHTSANGNNHIGLVLIVRWLCMYVDMIIKSCKKLGHWNKGKRLVFDIDLRFLYIS